MADKQTMIMVVGIAAVAVGGYFLFKAVKGGSGTNDLIVQFGSSEDLNPAQIVRDTLNPKQFIQGYVNPNTLEMPIVCIGGAASNPTAAQLTANGIFPEISQEDAGKGFIFVSSFNGQAVYEIAGWNAEDTLKAALFIKKLGGLPTQSVEV